MLVNIATTEKILLYEWIVFCKLTLKLRKACFLKLKIGAPFASNLFKTVTSFLNL